MVGAFVDHQNQAYAKVKALEEEIESHKKHILTLKRELSDAVRREYEEEVKCLTICVFVYKELSNDVNFLYEKNPLQTKYYKHTQIVEWQTITRLLCGIGVMINSLTQMCCYKK